MVARRNLVIALGAGSYAPLASFARQPLRRIAFLFPNSATAVAAQGSLVAFKEGLRDNGLIEGKHYLLEERYAGGVYERFPVLTRELLQRNPAVIMVSTIEAVRVAQKETKTVPIVMAATNDPVGSGLVASLARPGGNTTGLSTQAEDTIVKYVELVRETLPRAKWIAVLVNPGNPSTPKMFEQLRTAAGGYGIDAGAFEAATPAALDAVFGAIAQQRPDAFVVLRDAMFIGQHERMSAFALKNRIPLFAPTDQFVGSGSLISYAPSLVDMYRRSATYVAKILAGAKPADLPIEQPTRFELVLNMNTAKALGIKIPHSILVRVDRVIE